MEKRINISNYIKNGLTENNGLIIREKIEQALIIIIHYFSKYIKFL